MGQPGLTQPRAGFLPRSESAFMALAGAVARAWYEDFSGTALIGLHGDLGAGKTTWVRGMLAALGYGGRVPSPTYTLLEHYTVPQLDVVHLDLYRLGGTAGDADARGELEALGLRDWLARDGCWVLVEWPERSRDLLARCDVLIEFSLDGQAEARRVDFHGRSALGGRLVERLQELSELASS
jgi:tRNA threonylcarbamoyladenosine biosynthesis protein TsaE